MLIECLRRGRPLLGTRAALQELERPLEPPQRCRQVGALLDVEPIVLVHVVQQLQGVADVLGGRLARPSAHGAVASIQGAAPLGPAPQVYGAPAIDGYPSQDRPPR